MNNKGFSLVQIIISLGLFSGLFVAALKIVKNQTELGKSSSYRFESFVVMDEIKSVLSDNISCKETLGGLSGIYDDVRVIKKYDQRSKKSDQIYSTSEVELKALGQNNLYLKEMSLNGEISGFSNDIGYTMMVLNFSDKKAGGDIFKRTFPIRVSLNELGRIVDCQASPGIHQEKSSRTLNDPWAKVKNGNGDEEGIAFEGGPVTIGNVVSLGSLNAEGGLLLYDNQGLGECLPQFEGTLAFDNEKQTLFLCSKGGKWHRLHGRDSLLKIKKEFTVETTENIPKVLTTPDGYYICRLIKTESPAGQCSASPVNTSVADPQWELLVQNYREGKTLCRFTCMR